MKIALRRAFAASVLNHSHDQRRASFLTVLLAGVAVAAGLTGLVLVAFPGSTARFFSWGLEPEALVTLIGGSYLASAFVFGAALPRDWHEVRGLAAGTLALTIPILVVTFMHLDVFDFDRWQAWAWVILFVASPLSFGTVLYLSRGSVDGAGPRLVWWARAVSTALAVTFFAAAVALWWDPERASRSLPLALPPLGGRILGCWISFLAFLAGWSAVRGRWHEARIPLIGLAAFMAGALGGAVRSLASLEPPGQRVGYIVALVVLLVVTAVVAARGRVAPLDD